MNKEESILVLIIVSTSVAMFIWSFRYSTDVRTAPQIAALSTILFASIVFINDQQWISLGKKTDLSSEVNKKAAAIENEIGNDSSESVSDVAGPGEFRINLPVTEYSIPGSGISITSRTILVLLLFVYFSTIWLTGIFISTTIFLFLFKYILGVGTKQFIVILTFTIIMLLIFGFYLETPLFRPEHEFFDMVIQ